MIPARGKVSGAYVNTALAKTDAQRGGYDDAIFLDYSDAAAGAARGLPVGGGVQQ